MTDSYNTVAVRFSRLGWKIFSADVADSAQGTEIALTNIEASAALGAVVGDQGDTVQEVRINSENVVQYVVFKDGGNFGPAFPGPVGAGSQVRFVAGKDFAPFKVDSSWVLHSCGAAS